VSFSIPRAYIIAALPYSHAKTPVLPDRITPKYVDLLVGSKTGRPPKQAREGPHPEYSYSVALNGNYTGSNIRYRLNTCIGNKYHRTGSDDGYETYADCLFDIFLIPADRSQMRSVHCLKGGDRRRGQKCTHSLRVRDGIEMEIDIPDFRSNEGGLEAAEKQVGFALSVLCPMLQCDPRHTDYYLDKLGDE
jgi:hypothetical protein